jgi:molybdopterin-binding protein
MANAYELSDIRVQYQQEVLNIPSLQIVAHQTTTLLGENGAGKSTLLNLLACLSSPTSGQLTLFGESVQLPIRPEQRRRIGYVQQQPFLLKGTVIDNLRLALSLQGMPAKRHQGLIDKTVALFNLNDFAQHQAHQLSGGELKRAAIARAMVYQPDILLLDEPFSHLDQHHEQVLLKTMMHIQQQASTTLVFSSHDRLQASAIADHTINLVSGRVTQAPLINVLQGYLDSDKFITPQLEVYVADADPDAKHIAIAPKDIIVASTPLSSSMRNAFTGRLVQITQEAEHIRLMIDCGQIFYASITHESLRQLDIHLGDTLWIHFKATAVTAF